MSSSVEDRQQSARVVEEPLERRAVSPAESVADPGPLGLAAFATTTFVLSVFNAGILPKTLEAVVLPLALFYGGTAQLLAGMWEFKKANTFGVVAFTSYGAFWLSFAAYVKFIAPGLPPASTGTATGLFLLAWTIFTAYMTIASLRTTGAIAAVFLVLLVTLVLLVVGTLGGSAGAGEIGGYLGIVTAVLAWYASAAGVVNATWKRTVLPVMPLS